MEWPILAFHASVRTIQLRKWGPRRIRQAASSLGAVVYGVDASVKYAPGAKKPLGRWTSYSRRKSFEQIYRHHRYRITEGSEEIQKRKVAGFLFGYMGVGSNEAMMTERAQAPPPDHA